MKASFPKGSEDPYLNLKKVDMKVYLLRVIQFKINLSCLEVFHTNIIVIMFFLRVSFWSPMPGYIWPVNWLFVSPFPFPLLAIFSRFPHAKQRACSQDRLHTAKG